MATTIIDKLPIEIGGRPAALSCRTGALLTKEEIEQQVQKAFTLTAAKRENHLEKAGLASVTIHWLPSTE